MSRESPLLRIEEITQMRNLLPPRSLKKTFQLLLAVGLVTTNAFAAELTLVSSGSGSGGDVRNSHAVIADVSLKVTTTRQVSSNTAITFERGELPIILTAPHGGRGGIPGTPARVGKGAFRFNPKSDFNTDVVTEKLADALERKLGRRPYVVIARFHRKFVDANRQAKDAYEAVAAKEAYDAYHTAIDSARKEVQTGWGHGVMLDIHGQSFLPRAVLRGTVNGKTASHLVSRFGRAALIGKTSLFGQLAKQGFTVVPPVGSDAPETRNYNGGYSVITHGSGSGDAVDAIQLELGREYRASDTVSDTAEKLANAVAAFADKYLPAVEIQHAGKIQVGVYLDEGAGRSVYDLLRALGKFDEVAVTKLTAEQIRYGRLDGLDILIQPGGSGGGQGRHLGAPGREKIRGFVRGGGGFIGICAGAYLASAHYPWSLNLLDAKVIDTRHWNRGNATVDIALTDAGREVLSTTKEKLQIHYAQGPLLAPANRPEIEDYTEMARFETEVAKNGAPKGVMIGTTAIARGRFGQGRVICFSPHPEMTEDLETFVQDAIDHVKRNRSGH